MANTSSAVLKKSEGIVQFIKFGIVGVANTAVDWVVFYILINTALSGSETVAKAIAFIVAVLNSFIWNTIWTFRKEYQQTVGSGKALNQKSLVFGKFIVVSLIGWGINVLIFDQALKQFSFEILNNKELLPLVLASGGAILWNFFANKLWTYKK